MLYSHVTCPRRNTHLDIARIHDSPVKLALACTGGGSSAIARLLAVPGASRTLLDAAVPYHPAALAAYIGGAPDQACSGKTARALAMAAYQRAARIEPGHRPILGVGCTAALTTDRERRGTDRCHVAVQAADVTREYTLNLSRTGRDRAGQEAACGDLVIAAIAAASELDDTVPKLLPDESLSTIEHRAEPAWQVLFSGRLASTADTGEPPTLVFPGAFNPLHAGHRKMALIGEARSRSRVLLEISAFNVDKPPLDYVEMQLRSEGIGGEFAFAFSNAPTFVEKSELFPGATFIVGTDTLERIAAPRYYHDSLELRDRALDVIAARGVNFMVFGRIAGDRFLGLDDIDIPGTLRDICEGVPESQFREDISSTRIRRGD